MSEPKKTLNIHNTNDSVNSAKASVNYAKVSASVLKSDLLKIQKWAYQWMISFNQDQTNQAQEVIVLKKTNKNIYLTLFLNNATVKLSHTLKHLGLQLDIKLSLSGHTNNKINKLTKGKLQPILPRMS